MDPAWAIIGATLAALAAAHIPVRGVSLRQRWHTDDQQPHLGLRLLPDTDCTLTRADLEALAADCPVRISAISVHQQYADIPGEFAYLYRTIATRLGLGVGTWASVVVRLDTNTETNRSTATGFLRHRLGCLGVASRALSHPECAAAVQLPPLAQLARRRSGHHQRRPLVWVCGGDCAITAVVDQIIGVRTDGSAVTVCLPTSEQLSIAGNPEQLVGLIGHCVVTGATVAVRTHRPRQFAALLELGVHLIGADTEVRADVVLVDHGGAPSVGTLPGPHPAMVRQPADTGSAVVALVPPGSPRRRGTQISLGTHTWVIADGAQRTRIRPVQPTDSQSMAGAGAAMNKPRP
ncbi:hypothetical protein KRX51_01970 [Corynebacterium sp. TAE3-ERU12]|uniref:hypothetical protein n=1 Tax=Corynebacterium sp. TAE3-ERU12 TaxID=2849491 RepID=UPI001C46C5BA|nr:hypothetical protein [Corynebacterium sp. TAE3-ERU12]MBV7294685.1 hypothetical protein [Corynebacterium sp. TAE3-ERU12]